ncbi:MAG: efflux RND transporter periplasmic adaptor subunit, partial [Oscillospiraceae bacterium]
VTASIKEYDIKNIAIGQKVTIKSDATGETEIQGTVSQIGMTANGAQGSTEVTYPIEIKVVTKNSGLLIGMNVKSEIILSKKNGIFVVPDDAIGLNGMGDKVVYRKRGEDFIPVVVTTGEENDFYTQIISDELVEGMEIRASADEGGAAMLANDDMQSSAEMGGAPAGGMAMTMG